jgi:ribonuclease HI
VSKPCIMVATEEMRVSVEPQDRKKQIVVYTDGACSGNPGPGGWAAILQYGSNIKEISGGEKHTTNQRMEITAVLEALRCLKEPCDVTIYSDSAYVINCFKQKWYVGWRKNGWKNAKGQPVQNQDLWEALLEQVERQSVVFTKVKGHAGVTQNERCDELARGAIPK